MPSEIFNLARSYQSHFSTSPENLNKLNALLTRTEPALEDNDIIEFFQDLKKDLNSGSTSNRSTPFVKICHEFLAKAHLVQNNKTAILQYPKDIFTAIFKFLNKTDLAMLALSTHYFYNLIIEKNAIANAPYFFPRQNIFRKWELFSPITYSIKKFLLAPKLHLFSISANKILVRHINDESVVKTLTLEKEYGDIYCCAFTSDQNLVSTSYINDKDRGYLHIWDYDAGTHRDILINTDAPLIHLAIPSENKLVAINTNGKLWLWDTKTWNLEKIINARIESSMYVNELITTKQNQLIISTTDAIPTTLSPLVIIDIESEKVEKFVITDTPEHILAFPNLSNQFIASCSTDIYRFKQLQGSWNTTHVTKQPTQTTSLCFLNDTQIIIGSIFGQIKIYNLDNGNEEILHEPLNASGGEPILFLTVTPNGWIIGADLHTVYTFFRPHLAKNAENCNNNVNEAHAQLQYKH